MLNLLRAGMSAVNPARFYATYSANSANLTGGSSHYFNTASKTGATWSTIFSGGFTFFVWFKGSSFTDFSKICSCADSGLTMDVSLDVRSDGTVRFVYDEGATFAVAQTTGTYDDGNWHLACGIYDGSDAIIDIDGGAETVTDTGVSAPATASSVLAFGRLGDNSSNYFTGGLAFGGWSDAGFSGTDCSNLYNGGNPQCWDDIDSGTQAKIDGMWYLSNWSGTTSQELTDQAASDNLTNNNSTPYTATGLNVECSA
jgi:hypothetical protein